MNIKPLNIEETDGKARELLSAVNSKLGRVPNLFGVMAKAPSVLNTYLTTSENLKGGSLDARIGEQIAIALAKTNGCGYCLAAHTAIGKMVGLSDSELQNAQSGSAADPKARAALDLALSINDSHGKRVDQEVEAAIEAGLSESEIMEIAAHVALNILTNSLNGIAHTEIDFPAVNQEGSEI